MSSYSKRSINYKVRQRDINFSATSAYLRIQMHYSFTQDRFGVLFPSQVCDYNPSRSG